MGAGATMAAETRLEPKPNDPYFNQFKPLAAPLPGKLFLKKGDQLAICGDSITEQKKYSRLMEDYLTMCTPQLQINVRQFGWGGERAPGFLARLTNDCLIFHPTIATTCYGMNDQEYRAYEDRISNTYRDSMTAIVKGFQSHEMRVVVGSPGCVGYRPGWSQGATSEQLNVNLCTLRNIGLEIAAQKKARFADVFWPMLTASFAAQQKYGTNYALSGPDAIHPGWAGHTVMAYAFLKALGLDGNIGTFTVNLKRSTLKVSAGHKVISAHDGVFEIESSRYPFCPCAETSTADYPICGSDNLDNSQSIRSGMALVPFNQELNRLMLVVKNGTAPTYQVTWGSDHKTFTTEQLAHGINLAAEFPHNPFTEKFTQVDTAIAAKQAYETDEIKNQFEGQGQHLTPPEIAKRTNDVVKSAEAKRDELVAAVAAAFTPVTHTLKIEAL